MRLWPYALVAIYLSLAIAPVAAAECRRPKDEPPLSVNVEFFERDPTYSNSKSLAEIKMLNESARASSSNDDQTILGLTSSEIKTEYNTSIMSMETGGTPTCSWLRKLNVKILFSRFDVFVAKEFKPRSCQYNAILAHENQHVAIEKEMSASLYRETLARLKGLEPKLANATTRTKEELNKILASQLKPLFDENLAAYSERSKKAHAKIDTKESYAKVRASCKDWIKNHS
jgi:hypothetical protein